MKKSHKMMLPVLAAATPVLFANDAKPGDILQGINMFTPDAASPAYKMAADDRYGTQWGADLAYAFWTSRRYLEKPRNRAHLALLHLQINQRIIPDVREGGTWLRAEFSGSWRLDSKTVAKGRDPFATCGASYPHADYFGPHDAVLPEVALMHYFAGKRACITAGMLNLTNYLDAVGIANDSFATFANAAFTNSTVLPLPDSNAGAVLQVEMSRADFAMLAVSRTGAVSGSNPFTSGPPGFCVVGEYGHIFCEGGVTLRINPFYQRFPSMENTDVRPHHQGGIAASVEYEPGDYVSLFARSGISTGGFIRTRADFTCGSLLRLIPARPDDFLGIAYGVVKADKSAVEDGCMHREHLVELVYNLQMTPWFKIMPHIQYTRHPAYGPSRRDEVIAGIQSVLSF